MKHPTTRPKPDALTLEDLMEEVGDLKGMLGNALDEIAAIKKSVTNLRQEIIDRERDDR